MTASRYVLARRPGMQLDDFAKRCGLHPDMVRRLVALGLRTGLGLNYAAIGLVLDLLDHIEELESASRRRRTSPWTSTS